MEFTGFRDEAFAYFKELTENNSEEWFEANQARFDEFVLAPMRALVVSLREDLRRLHPALVQDDIDAHFSEMRRGPHSRPGSAPIKTSFYSFFWDSSVRRLNDGWFFVGVSADGVTIGMSIYDFGDPECRMRRIFKPRLRRYLTHLDDYIKANYLRRGFDFHRYVRAAGKLGIREVDPFPAAAAEWDSTLGWVVKRHLHTESSRLTPGSFLTEVKESFERLYPLYSFTSDPREEFLRLVRVPMRARMMHASVASVAPPKAALQVSPAADSAPKTEGATSSPADSPTSETAKTPSRRKRASIGPRPTETAKEAQSKPDKVVAKKAPSKKGVATTASGTAKGAPKKAKTKKVAAKKATGKKTPAVKTPAKKAVAKKTAGKKKATAKKTSAKKTVSKKVAGKKKTTAKKTAPKKPVTKRPTHKKKVAAKKKAASKSGKRATSSARAGARAR